MDQDTQNESQVDKVEPVCTVCGKSRPSYKCPKCYAKYCSVNCCKAHKSTSGACTVPVPTTTCEPEQKEVKRNYYFPTKDTVPREKLQLLAQGSNLVQLKKFLQDPTIRSNVLKLDTCSNPIHEFDGIMKDESFVKFAAFVTDQLNPNVSKRPKLDLDSD